MFLAVSAEGLGSYDFWFAVVAQAKSLLLKTERWLTKGTVAIHLLKLMRFIFLNEIIPNMFFN